MDAQTIFYILGGTLVLLAILISAVGMRSESFPSTGALRAGVALVALVVIATAAGAVLSAQAEQEDRQAENQLAAAETEEQAAQNEEAGGGGSASGSQEVPEGGGTAPGDSAIDEGPGSQVFVGNGCGSCHTLTAAGDAAVGQIGPNLDEALVDKDTDFIRTSIVDPSDFVEEGYGDDIMPQIYEDRIAPKDLDELVTFLSESTSSGGK